MRDLGDLAVGSCFLNQSNKLGTDKRRYQGHPSGSLSIKNIWFKNVLLNSQVRVRYSHVSMKI